jgi:parallel beta-helix repeat protein
MYINVYLSQILLHVGVYIALFFCSLSFAVPPPADGDWIIDEDFTIEDQTIILNGNLIVQSTGNLTLRNITLKMNCSFPGEHGILAEGGGSLSIYSSSITSISSNNTYSFRIGGTKFLLKDTSISGVMEGILIYNSNEPIIEGNTIIHKDSSGLGLHNCEGAVIKGNLIEFTGQGGELGGIGLLESHNSEVSENTLKKQIHAIDLTSSWNNIIANNEVTVKSHSTGIVVRIGSGNNVISNNTISKDPTADWA